jgi:hypothetical protein
LQYLTIMQSHSDYKNHHHGPVMPQVVRLDDSRSKNKLDEEINYQRAAGILRDFHSTHCCPPLNVIHEDMHDDNDDSDGNNNNNCKVQSERHLFEFSGLIPRSNTVTCLTALSQPDGSGFREEQEQESLPGSTVAAATSNGEEAWGNYTSSPATSMLSKSNTLSGNLRVQRKPSSFSSRSRQSSPLSRHVN